MYKRILVATDGSRLSRKAVKAAIELAGRLDATLVAAHVVPKHPVDYFSEAVVLRPEVVSKIERQLDDKGQELVDGIAAEAREAGVEAECFVARSDSPAEALVAAVRKHKCDLVVMASHGRRGLQRILLGSETQHVLAGADVPVLVLR